MSRSTSKIDAALEVLKYRGHAIGQFKVADGEMRYDVDDIWMSEHDVLKLANRDGDTVLPM